MGKLAIAMDLGTSGIRAQAIDPASQEIISTVITLQHPLPGGNVMDHLHFALELGIETAQRILINAVNHVIGELRIVPDEVEYLAICGNSVQLSLFEGIEIRDLAYPGRRKLDSLGVVSPDRGARIRPAGLFADLSLPENCQVILPPAVTHHVGADAVAMIVQSGMLQKDEISLAMDFGTNVEMAIFCRGRVFTASAPAGPALEGQQITCGMLAAPGAVSDLITEGPYVRLVVLDSKMLPAQGALVDLAKGTSIEKSGGGPLPIGITGTGTAALVCQAIESGLITLPNINTPEKKLHLAENIFFTEDDLREAGKAFGAVRSGYLTLCRQAGICPDEIHTVYMSGASGTYVDAVKALRLGLVPPCVRTIHQIGNTSLSMASDLVLKRDNLDKMIRLAADLRKDHCLLSASEIFKKLYLLEFSYWTEGMPLSQYNRFLSKYELPELTLAQTVPEIVRPVQRDIKELGRLGLVTIRDIGRVIHHEVEGCIGCMYCVKECPGRAISAGERIGTMILDESLCVGLSCRRCEQICPCKVFHLNEFFAQEIVNQSVTTDSTRKE